MISLALTSSPPPPPFFFWPQGAWAAICHRGTLRFSGGFSFWGQQPVGVNVELALLQRTPPDISDGDSRREVENRFTTSVVGRSGWKLDCVKAYFFKNSASMLTPTTTTATATPTGLQKRLEANQT